jgi:hypothetical protein
MKATIRAVMELNVRPENPERESFVGIAAEQNGRCLG